MFTLVIGSKNLSSWSLRPWLALKMLGEPFEEVLIPLGRADSKQQILAYNPAGKVPFLRDRQLAVWDSLAICEYLADCFPGKLWPLDAAQRAEARSMVAEMHSGFTALRQELPMNVTASLPGKPLSDAALADIERIVDLWEHQLERNQTQGPFLFGEFSIADAFFAPVVWRFHTYHVALPALSARYAAHLRALPAMQQWLAEAEAEG